MKLLSSLPTNAEGRDFTIIPTVIKLRSLFLSGWHTKFLLILSFLFFYKKEKKRLPAAFFTVPGTLVSEAL